MKPNITTEQCIEWLNDELSCEDGTSEKYFYFLTTIRDKLLAANKLASAVEEVVSGGVMKTEGPFPSPKNNKCSHGRSGYEGCEHCIDEHLIKALAQWKDTEINNKEEVKWVVTHFES